MPRISRNNVGGQAPRKLTESKETKAKEKQAKADGAGTSAAADETLPSSPTSSKFLSVTTSFGSTASSAPNTSVSKRITKWLGGYESSSQPSTPGSSRRSTGHEEIQISHTDSHGSQPSTASEHVLAPVEAPESKPKSKLGRNLAIGAGAAVGIAGGMFAAPFLLTPGPGDDDSANLPNSAP